MPVRPLTRTDAPDEEGLKKALLDEMQHPNKSGEPDVIIDDRAGGGVHLFVVWGRWMGLEQIVRSRLILDAYEEWKGEQEALRVTVSMGLLPEDAKAMGILQ
jgi:hypothetical protein